MPRDPNDFVLHVRMPRQLRDDAETILTAAGLSVPHVIRILFQRIIDDQNLPFELFPPSERQLANARTKLEKRERTYDRRTAKRQTT